MTKQNQYSKSLKTRPVPICPHCKKQATETITQYGVRNQCCNLHSWDRYPLVCVKTHESRKQAHLHFDRIWKNGLVTRSKAYSLLGKALSLKRDDCHIKFMDKETALRVPLIAMTIERRLNGN